MIAATPALARDVEAVLASPLAHRDVGFCIEAAVRDFGRGAYIIAASLKAKGFARWTIRMAYDHALDVWLDIRREAEG